jgi:class 3 adenylate cyclase
MDPAKEHAAWLERDEEQYILQGNCSIGRAALNTVVVESPKVSRLHAIIHSEKPGAFWLIDLASSNGTFLNKRRIHEPVRLHDQDQITIGGHAFAFRHAREALDKPKSAATLLTLKERIEDVPCWLLVADIENFTPLSRELVSDKLATLVSSWLAICKEVIEKHQGAVNKYLGDGFLAFWYDNEDAAKNIVNVITALKNAQRRGDPVFRFVVHFGSVAVGGVAPPREETLMGSEVNFVFRLEKLAASLGEACGVSEAAQLQLAGLISTRRVGDFELKGFEGKKAFFAV